MKNILLSASLLAATFITAQLTETRFGVNANIHQSNVGNIHYDSKGRIAPAIGIFAQIPLKKYDGGEQAAKHRVFFVPQLEFNMAGESDKQEGAGTVKYHNNYINLPLYFKYYFGFQGENGPHNAIVQAGPVVGVAVSQNVNGKALLAEYQAADDNFKNFDLGLSVGLGYRIAPDFEALVRYDYGLLKPYEYKNRTYNYQLGVGINWLFR
ncbi:MAG: PorT family protein [Chryseobacterium sp.]|nr:MAG: PorT family protein [Chryseobacterium sp.]